MDNKIKLQRIEEEITRLTKKRTELFNEWAYLVKKNDRDFDLNGFSDLKMTKKADDLLLEQRAIGKQVMRLLEQADNLIVD
ncbi:MAG: hypothetical protein HC913_05055 [Microscillaceae bacterium]|nr:hypothetical protein [Microscillaceae bacterium]